MTTEKNGHSCHHHTHHKSNPDPNPSLNVLYTCPMHPQIEQMGPGSCPICGMALEPKEATHIADTSELKDMSRRLWICGSLALPLLLLVMLDHLPGHPISSLFSSKALTWIQFALATPTIVWGAAPFFKKAWHSVVSWHLNMFTLIALGTGSAYAFSIIATLFPEIFPPDMRQHNGTIEVYFEAAAVITTLVILGQVLELRARSQTNSAIRALLDLAPKKALRLNKNGKEEEVLLDQIQPGDKLRVRPGDAVPVDGIVIEGESTIDESMISGEAMPVLKKKGAAVTGGTLNQTGSFVMEAQHVGAETVLSQIVRLVADAQRSQAPIQKLADVVAGYFVPIVVLAATITAGVWIIWGPPPAIAFAMTNAVAVLIIACPCAIGLATPMSIMVGTGRGAQAGVLIKNAQSLELMQKATILIIDKTGTLTEGCPALTSFLSEKEQEKKNLLQQAASLEKNSEHPLATALVNAAKKQKLKLKDCKEFKSYTGKGVVGLVDKKQVALGNDKLLKTLKVPASALIDQADSLRAKGETVMYLVVEGKLAALVGVSDPIKPSTPEALQTLRQNGMHIVMLTGDNEKTASVVARALKIDEVEAEISPASKSEVVQEMQNKGHIVAMAGDGINDAPALAQANVGIAMGTGADIAMESADITLLKGDLNGIVRARKLSQATMTNIRQNLFFAFFYNAASIPLAAGALYPFFDLLLNPMIASAAMTFSSVSVILNAARLKKVPLH